MEEEDSGKLGDIYLSKHASKRMGERRLSMDEVREAIKNPVQHVYDRWRDVYIAVSWRGVAVVYAMHGGRIEVLTVLSKREYEALISKYGLKRYKTIY